MAITISVPHPVLSGQPHSVFDFGYRIRMAPKDPKSYLWENIAALMRTSAPSVDAVQLKTKVGRGTVQRIKEGETSVGLDVLMSIAKAFGIEVWQLLVPGIDPSSMPSISANHVHDWPFSAELLEVSQLAKPTERRQAENAARACLDMDPLPRVANARAA